MELPYKNNHTITLTAEDESPVIYNGPDILPEFRIHKITANSRTTNSGSIFTVSIHLSRLYSRHLTTTYLQTFLLWFLAFLTLFIEPNDFSNRFVYYYSFHINRKEKGRVE